MSIEKRLALRLVRHAAYVLPGPLASWGAAMRHEIEYIEPNFEALKWAVGCVSTSYIRRLASINVVKITLIRWLLAVFIASWAIDDLFAAHWFYLKTAGWLGLRVKKHDYLQYMSALNALPTWIIVLDGASGLLYIAAAYCLMRKKISSTWVLLAGTALSCTACVGGLILVCHSVLSADGLGRGGFTYGLHIGIIALLWYGFARDRTPPRSDQEST
jgi:hypothetical protein